MERESRKEQQTINGTQRTTQVSHRQPEQGAANSKNREPAAPDEDSPKLKATRTNRKESWPTKKSEEGRTINCDSVREAKRKGSGLQEEPKSGDGVEKKLPPTTNDDRRNEGQGESAPRTHAVGRGSTNKQIGKRCEDTDGAHEWLNDAQPNITT